MCWSVRLAVADGICGRGCTARWPAWRQPAAGSDLAAAEQDAGVRRGPPVRRRARLVEIAQTLLHREATIRAAGDELSVPTSALRWLREAGFRIGADGTLTGSAGPAPPPGKDQKDHGSGASGTVTAIAAPASADRPASSPAATGRVLVQELNELAQADMSPA